MKNLNVIGATMQICLASGVKAIAVRNIGGVVTDEQRGAKMINRILERLEEYKYTHLVERDKERLEHCTENERAEHCEGIDCFWCVWDRAIQIVQEVAKEYDEFDVIYKKVLELEKEYAESGDLENVNRCIRLENLLQYFKEELIAPYQKGE